jgi:hypothetical protein
MSVVRIPIVAWLLVAGCTRPDERMVASADPPPATVVAPIEAGTPLDELLARLDAELAAALDRGLDGDEGMTRLMRAEAISDRLLEARLPFAWLTAEAYSLPARLRQIQASSDRVVALVRGGAQAQRLDDQTTALRADVSDLRAALARGGGPAPPTLDMLLAGRDTTDRYAAEGGGE